MPGSVSLVISILGRRTAWLMSCQRRAIRWSTSLYALNPITASSRLMGSSTRVRGRLQINPHWRSLPSRVLLIETLWPSMSTLIRVLHTRSKTSWTSDLSSNARMSRSLTARQDRFTEIRSSSFQDSERLAARRESYGRISHFQADAGHPGCAVRRGPPQPHRGCGSRF